MEREWEAELKGMKYLDMPTTGDASESGLIKFFQPIEDITKIRDRFPVVRDNESKECRMPFNSNFKYAVSVNNYEREGSHFYCTYQQLPLKESQRRIADKPENQISSNTIANSRSQ